MRKRLGSAGAAALVLALATPPAASAGAEHPADFRQAVVEAHRKLIDALHAGDCKAVGTIFTSNGAALPPNAPRAQGRAAIEKACAAAGTVSLVLDVTELSQNGSAAWCSGGYKVLGADGKPADAGKYVEIWSRTDSGWKVHTGIWNSDRPPPSATPGPPPRATASR